ncbi:hypothetical protein PRZ48_006691 [Zasmidium cellare]|uniref:F-box domain-containing protein n=1 Tax=Zasmidium cellare TaxID=395010 RepID=A0ABR0EQ85_ZASCE|nr:hypothetical protein PRZ48_006691 [Zasmidium cellare]
MDPLTLLPSELVLRILEFTPTSDLASLTRLNRSWHAFIDETHQEAIYFTPGRTDHAAGLRDVSLFEKEPRTFAKYYQDVESWKDLCRRQTLLSKNWDAERPLTTERKIIVGRDPIWRFRPDFQRRIILSTSHEDMDSGDLLWKLERDDVRPFAHLEYADGVACWDCDGEGIEVWRIGRERGVKVKVLEHEVQTRGFQLSCFGGVWCLCVVSNAGCGFVYEGEKRELELTKRMVIPTGAVGHLDQDEGVVVYSLGSGGYHFFEKGTGEKMVGLKPEVLEPEVFHIVHPDEHFRRGTMEDIGKAARDRTVPLAIRPGPLPGDERVPLEDDEWGAGMLSGNLFVGVSRAGRLLICPNWRALIPHTSPTSTAPLTDLIQIIECDSDGSTFDLGGWLSVRDHRVLLEIQDLIYIIGLTDSDHVRDGESRPSFATSTAIKPQYANPVSFMGLYEDCLMSTYTTLLYRSRSDEAEGVVPRIFQTKAVRVLNLAPDLSGHGEVVEDEEEELDLPVSGATRAELFHLIALLARGEDGD